ncbi:MAG: hypothetical protein WBQ44_00210, partial [Rhodococcus sp. (in: high G+C Gram-positive bacteria)]
CTPTVVDDSTLRVDLGTIDPADVIKALFDAGLQVRGLSQSTRLEDVFLDLVHNDALPAPVPAGSVSTKDAP